MKLIFFLCFTVASVGAVAQDYSKMKFGDITEKDFANKVYSIDSNAGAVVITDIGSSKIEGNTKGWFSLVYKHYKRVHILNKNGYDIANVSIPLYSNGDDEEKLDKLKAVTYNLENGKVTESKLDIKAGLFKDKINKNQVVKKFTLPAVKEGSIIEYEYTIISDFLHNLQPWEFQGSYPRLWSEYNLALPDFLGYVFLTQGYKAYDINEQKTRFEPFSVLDTRSVGTSDRYNFNSNVTDFHWVIKNVPALKEENFTSTLDNHICKIEFQLSEFRAPLTERRVIESWPKVAEGLINAESFGLPLKKDDGWVKDMTNNLRAGSSGKADMAKRIFEFVRDQFTCTDHSDLLLDQTLKNLAKSRKGTVAEINLLLTALLRSEDIVADPVILSTRSNGFTYALYPLMSQYNYVVCRVQVGDQLIYLDASEPGLGFGRLPLRCYNGHARVINSEARAIELLADSLTETKFTSVFVVNDEKGNMTGSIQQTPGYYESFELRNRIREKGTEQLQKDIVKDFGADIVMSNFAVDSLNKYDEVLGIRYEFAVKAEKEDIIYLNPMFGEGYKENPFKSAERLYPVEMPFAMDETYNLQMEVPQGYVVDELPKSMVVKLNEENEGMFEYRASLSGNYISFRCRVKISRANFAPDEYEMLREFFNLVVKKQAEQIVFKKKS